MKAISLDRSSGTIENRIVKKDKSLADMEWTAQWSATEKALFCVVHDTTERKQIDRLKADFVAMVSHDLRTPLTSVQGFLELLGAEAYGPLSEQGYDSLEMTESSVTRLISLINDLLDIEKMESGMLDLHIEPADMSTIFKRSVDSVSAFANQNSVTIILADKEKKPLDADADRLVQVIVNLLSNAIKFSPKGESIAVQAETKGTQMRVTILDRGRGVPANMRESIFERFKQVERNDERKKGGSGLGLAICKAIVERHGGTIGVDANPGGQGSMFWFILPTVAPTPTNQKATSQQAKR
jgi:signal transduction histidine kinase